MRNLDEALDSSMLDGEARYKDLVYEWRKNQKLQQLADMMVEMTLKDERITAKVSRRVRALAISSLALGICVGMDMERNS